MEALCCLVKAVRFLMDVLPPSLRKQLREVVPVFRGFMSTGYPQIIKPEKTPGNYKESMNFGNPDMMVSEAWKNIQSTGQYTGYQDLVVSVKQIIEFLNPIKTEALANAKITMDRVVKLQEANKKNDSWVKSQEVIRVRKEMYEIMAKYGGKVPTEAHYDDYIRYNNAISKIKRYEEEKPTILEDIDNAYKELLKEEMNKK